AGAGLGLEHHRFFEDGFPGRRERPSRQLIGTAWRIRINNGDGVGGKVLSETCSGCQGGCGSADNEAASIHDILPLSRLSSRAGPVWDGSYRPIRATVNQALSALAALNRPSAARSG